MSKLNPIMAAALLAGAFHPLFNPAASHGATPLGTAFTYQGQLSQGSAAANGTYAMRFTLFDAVTSGNTVAGPLTNNAVTVSNGLFTVAVDFGAQVFAGNAGWLQIDVHTNSAGASFASLTPRQALTAVPNAHYAESAASVPAGSVSATQLGTPAAPAAGQYLLYNGSSLAWSTPPGGWALTGNAGTTPGVNFIGTTDPQAFELRTANQRALRLEPGIPGAPNVIGGSISNSIASGTFGSTIAGGTTNTILAGSLVATISGGNGGVIGNGSPGAVIGGGEFNSIGMSNNDAVVVGGTYNVVGDYAYAAVVGGYGNYIGWNAIDAGIQGGTWNSVGDNGYESCIAGGIENTNSGLYSFIGGGTNNTVDANSTWGVVAGGAVNFAGTGYAMTIGGGYYNYAYGASYSTVGGGYRNYVQSSAPYSTIPGGSLASTRSYGQMAYASGATSSYGDAQTSLYVLRNTTANATLTELFLDGVSSRMLVPTNGTWTFQVMVVARNTAGSSACFQASGGVKSSASGVVSFVGAGTPAFTTLATDFTGPQVPAPQLVADTANGALDVKATGLNGQTIRWVARLQTAELIYP